MPLQEIDAPGMLPSQINSAPEMDQWEGYEDYFGYDEVIQFHLPDGRQFIEFKPLTEGGRAKYEALTSRDIKFNRRTEDASLKMDAATDRHALIEASVVNWNLVRRSAAGRWEPVPFSSGSKGSTLNQWLDKTNPKVVNDLLEAIRRANPWMVEELTVDMIDEEMKRLESMRGEALQREAAKKSS